MVNILCVIDMQNDFIDGALGTREAEGIVSGVVKRVREHKGVLFFTRDTHGEDYLTTSEGKNLPVKHCIKGTLGWQICDGLLPYVTDENVIDKPTFGSAKLARLISERFAGEEISVTLVGLCTDICVISNAMLLKAYMPEASIYVDSALCAGVNPESHERALLSMKTCQITVI